MHSALGRTLPTARQIARRISALGPTRGPEDRAHPVVYGAAFVTVLGAVFAGEEKFQTTCSPCMPAALCGRIIYCLHSGYYATRPVAYLQDAYGRAAAASAPAAAAPARRPPSRSLAVAAGRPFTAPSSRFKLFRITGDGSCMFRAIVQVTVARQGCTGNRLGQSQSSAVQVVSEKTAFL